MKPKKTRKRRRLPTADQVQQVLHVQSMLEEIRFTIFGDARRAAPGIRIHHPTKGR